MRSVAAYKHSRRPGRDTSRRLATSRMRKASCRSYSRGVAGEFERLESHYRDCSGRTRRFLSPRALGPRRTRSLSWPRSRIQSAVPRQGEPVEHRANSIFWLENSRWPTVRLLHAPTLKVRSLDGSRWRVLTRRSTAKVGRWVYLPYRLYLVDKMDRKKKKAK